MVIAGETGTAAGYNGTWTILSASGDTFTYTNSATGLPTLTFNANGYAISTNKPAAACGAPSGPWWTASPIRSTPR